MMKFIDWVLNINFRSCRWSVKIGLACKAENMRWHSKRSSFLAWGINTENCSRDIKSLTGTLPLRFLNLVWPSLMKRTTPTSAPKLMEPSEFPSFLLPLFTTFDFWVCVCVFFLQFFLFHNLCRSCLWVHVNRYWSFSL